MCGTLLYMYVKSREAAAPAPESHASSSAAGPKDLEAQEVLFTADDEDDGKGEKREAVEMQDVQRDAKTVS